MSKRYKLHQSKGRVRRVTFIVAAALLGLALLLAGVHLYYRSQLQAVSQSDETVHFIVTSGETAGQIGDNLVDQGLIRSSQTFKWYVSIHKVRDSLQAGSYELRPNMSTPDVVSVLTHGKITTDLVTILPGLRIDQVRETLIESGFSAEEVDLALDPDTYRDHPVLAYLPVGANLEGYIYPESFQKDADTTAAEIIEVSLDEMNAALTADVRAGFQAHGLDVHQGITLASVVEREAPEAERPLVAQVFLSRLSLEMPLQSDPTSMYGARLDGLDLTGAFAPIRLHDSPYNTYMYPGLPVGPISNVNKSALEAVAHPADTDWLYFVAGSDGKTYYSRTIAEHEAKIAEVCRPRCGTQ